MNDLLKNGIVTCKKSKNQKIYSITNKGKKIYRQIKTKKEKIIKEILNSLKFLEVLGENKERMGPIIYSLKEFEKEYVPLICPNKKRSRRYYKKISRKFYKQRREIYKQRGRGESLFGSLTNEFGDRFKSANETSMQVRILGRIISYQIKLLIRCDEKIISIDVLIIRHALGL